MSINGMITVSQAAERSELGTRYILDEIERGTFPNARRLDPTKATSPYLIPEKDFEKWLKTKKYIHKEQPE